MNEYLLSSVKYRGFVPLGTTLLWANDHPERTVVKNNHVIGVLSPSHRALFMPELPCPIVYLPKLWNKVSSKVTHPYTGGGKYQS